MKTKRLLRSLLPVYVFCLGALLLSALGSSRAVTTITQNAPLPQRRCVIIDAGHGGEDGGATSCSGVLESQINLEIALRLNDLLGLLGYDTRMVRTTDTSVYTQGTTIAAKKASDLKERVKLVNSEPNALLISIHQNTFSDSRYSGAQVFFARDTESRALAKALQAALVEYLNPGSQRQPKRATGIYLMEHIDRPGALIECGFLSNPEEEARLRDPSYQQSLCCVIAATVSNFLDQT